MERRKKTSIPLRLSAEQACTDKYYKWAIAKEDRMIRGSHAEPPPAILKSRVGWRKLKNSERGRMEVESLLFPN